ncbi:MAG: dihydroorotate dehydrogenase-like protein [Spirochaetales bacterium]|nr:dihydroorotate dehydrogenase-like protein [Spirochaetales bacterium]
MADLRSSYMGIQLKNPIIVSSSHLTSSLDKILECDQAGAGAIVLKSLFEEQILADTKEDLEGVNLLAHADAMDFFQGMGKKKNLEEYLEILRDAKAKVSCPLIASLNCVTTGSWLNYADKLEEAGADALELNFFILPVNFKQNSEEIENRYMALYKEVQKRVKIPIAMKLGSYFSSLAQLAQKLSNAGVNGLVFFNRFYRPDININTMELKTGKILSEPIEISQTLHWTALLSGRVRADIASNTGIHDGEALIKVLLAGASAAQICSTLSKNGLSYISTMLKDLEIWMNKNNFPSVADFQGKLASENIDNPEFYERAQYIRAIAGLG